MRNTNDAKEQDQEHDAKEAEEQTEEKKLMSSLYFRLHKVHRDRIAANESLNISSYELFASIRYRGV